MLNDVDVIRSLLKYVIVIVLCLYSYCVLRKGTWTVFFWQITVCYYHLALFIKYPTYIFHVLVIYISRMCTYYVYENMKESISSSNSYETNINIISIILLFWSWIQRASVWDESIYLPILTHNPQLYRVGRSIMIIKYQISYHRRKSYDRENRLTMFILY